ncbi:MAG: transcription termination factor NusA [Lachnospiraceae bacterium]
MSNELLEALNMLEEEKGITRETLIESIRDGLEKACEENFGHRFKGDDEESNIIISIDPETCEYKVEAQKRVVREVTDPETEISLMDARMNDSTVKIDDIVKVNINTKEFSRIATKKAKEKIRENIRKAGRNAVFNQYAGRRHDVVTGVIQRKQGSNYLINLGRTDTILSESNQVPTETYRINDHIKVYIVDVKDTPQGPKILVSRTKAGLVKKLFESEVAEIAEGIVEIKSISREPGSRSKIAVYSSDPDVDPVGACVGMNGSRVNAVVEELQGEKIDIVLWDDNPSILIENALSPAKVIFVDIEDDDKIKSAKVIVPDYQLSLAIGKEGQNARLAAKLTGFKIDIKSETQARESGELEALFEKYNISMEDFEEGYSDEEESDEYDEYDDDYDYEDGEFEYEETEESEDPEE